MKLLQRLSKVIKDFPLIRKFSYRVANRAVESSWVEAMSRLDPAKIYVENVRAVLHVPTKVANVVCETAVRQGRFTKGIEILGPDDKVAAEVSFGDEFPIFVMCDIFDGQDYEEQRFATADLKKRTFYHLNEDTALTD